MRYCPPDGLPPFLVHSFSFLIFRPSYSSLSFSLSCFFSTHSHLSSSFPSFVSLLLAAYSAVPLGTTSVGTVRFLHRDRSPARQTGPFNLRPINLDKLNEWRPAFDARVNREYLSPLRSCPFRSISFNTYAFFLFLESL